MPRRPSTLWRRCASRSTSTRHCTTTGTCSRLLARRRFGVDARLRRAGHVGHRAAAARAGRRARRREPPAASTCSAPRRTRARSRRSPPGTRPATSSTSRATARPTRTTRRPRWLERIGLPYDDLLLLVGQDLALHGDRHRRADRRQPAEHPARAGGRHRRRRRSRTPGTASCAARRASSARPTGPSSRSGSTPVLAAPLRAAGNALVRRACQIACSASLNVRTLRRIGHEDAVRSRRTPHRDRHCGRCCSPSRRGAWAYDHGKRDTIAEGVRVGGVDVGGMSADEARATLRERAADAAAAAGRRDLRGQTRRAVGAARRRRGRRRAGASTTRSRAAATGFFITRVGARRDRRASVSADDRSRASSTPESRSTASSRRSATASTAPRATRASTFSPTSLEPVTGQRRRLRSSGAPLRRAIVHALTDAPARSSTVARARARHAAKGDDRRACEEVPRVVITVDRLGVQASLLQEPAGEEDLQDRRGSGVASRHRPASTTVQNKAINPTWHVPDSAWAGKLGGQGDSGRRS